MLNLQIFTFLVERLSAHGGLLFRLLSMAKKLTDYRRDSVGFVFQFYNLVPNLTVTENIEVVSNISKSPLDIETVLKVVGLEAKKRSFPRELSGGEQQRVAIARAIDKNPKLLLCDEPTGALDYEKSRGVLSHFQKITRDFGTTVLMISHNTAIGDMANVAAALGKQFAAKLEPGGTADCEVKSGQTLRVFAMMDTVNIPAVQEGNLPGRSEIMLDRLFAETNRYNRRQNHCGKKGVYRFRLYPSA